MADADYVFVGSGINALVAAALLGRKGRKVCVLERNDRIGGCIRTEEMTRALMSPGLEQEMLSSDYTQLPRAIQWGYKQADEAFITSIIEGRASVVNVDDAYAAIELCEACYRSAAQDGATITLPLS